MLVLVSVPVMVEPVPLAAIPVRLTVLSRVQLNVVPATALGLVIVIVPIALAEQTVCVAGVALTVGLGFTVTETVCVVVQVPSSAVIVNMVVCAVFVVLVSVPEIALPVPLVAIPVMFTVLFLVQLNVVPGRLFGLVISI